MFEELAIFAGLTRPEAREVLVGARRREGTAGHVFFEQDEEATELFVLGSGRAKLTRVSADGRQIVVQLVRPGEVLGCGCHHPGAAHPTSAVAIAPSTVLVWNEETVFHLAERFPVFALNVLSSLRRQLTEAHERVGELATARADQRVALALLRLAAAAGSPHAVETRIELPVSREDIAQMAGTTLYTVSRVIAGWEREGLLELGRQLVVILRRDGIELHARG